MAKKAKGHSKKKRHFIGVPEQGVGLTKERKMARVGRIISTRPLGCLCDLLLFFRRNPRRYVRLVRPTGGTGRTVLWCATCLSPGEVV